MSLDYDTRAIVDREDKFPGDERGLMNDDLHVLIWTTMQVGIYQITEANYREFAWRMEFAAKLGYPMYNRVDGEDLTPYVLPADRVRDAIGLSTNASPLTRHQFIKHFTSRFFDDHEREARREQTTCSTCGATLINEDCPNYGNGPIHAKEVN